MARVKDHRPPKTRGQSCPDCGGPAADINRSNEQVNGKWIFECSTCGARLLSVLESNGRENYSYWNPLPRNVP